MSIEKPKHGKEFTLDFSNPKVKESINHIYQLHETATEMLQMVFLTRLLSDKFNFPCMQCYKDTALQFKDLGAAIEELLELKS